MPYLIDGHNLIPYIRGLSLDEPDDEMRLVELLQTFCRKTGKQVHVYFDQAPAGQPRQRTYGAVKAHFVRADKSADDAIYNHLKRLGGAARNWTVVSSDRMVMAGARAAHARVVLSADFARQVEEAIYAPPAEGPSESDLSQSEVEDWMDFFGETEE